MSSWRSRAHARRRVLQRLRKRLSSGGELSDQLDVSKPTMSAHFAVLKEADLVHAEKAGKSVVYHLKLSVLEEARLGFIDSFGLGAETPEPRAEIGMLAPAPIAPSSTPVAPPVHRSPAA